MVHSKLGVVGPSSTHAAVRRTPYASFLSCAQASGASSPKALAEVPEEQIAPSATFAQLAMGQNPVPPVNIPIPTQIN